MNAVGASCWCLFRWHTCAYDVPEVSDMKWRAARRWLMGVGGVAAVAILGVLAYDLCIARGISKLTETR